MAMTPIPVRVRSGDHVKFGMPENYSAATLGWGYYEFRDAYEKTGQNDHIETILRYFNDYLMKCIICSSPSNDTTVNSFSEGIWSMTVPFSNAATCNSCFFMSPK